MFISECHCDYSSATTCDPMTGYCQCLPGVTGPKCDQCMNRYVRLPNKTCTGQTSM